MQYFLFLSYYFCMKYLRRFILIICMFFISLAANAYCCENDVCIQKQTDTISAVNFHDYDILYSRNNSQIIQNIENQNSSFLNNKGNYKTYDGGLNKPEHVFINRLESLFSYIYVHSFLRNKTKISFLIALSEINPNAP